MLVDPLSMKNYSLEKNFPQKEKKSLLYIAHIICLQKHNALYSYSGIFGKKMTWEQIIRKIEIRLEFFSLGTTYLVSILAYLSIIENL